MRKDGKMAQSQPKKKPGPKPGSPYKQSEAVLEKLRQAFAIDATVEEACFYADINPATYYIWKKAKPEQFEKIERLRNTPILAARQTLATHVKTSPELALKYLERKRKSEFALKTETDLHIKELPKPILNGMSQVDVPSDDSNAPAA